MDFKTEINEITAGLSYYESDEFDKKISTSGIHIYGAGFLGTKYADILTNNGYNIISLFETEPKVKEANGIKVEKAYKSEYPVIISSFKYYEEIRHNLLKIGYDDRHILSPYSVFEKFYIPLYKEAFDTFDDELSKKIVIDKIKYHVIAPTMVEVHPYFIDGMFSEKADDVLVDAGAFDGDSALEFIMTRNCQYKKIYCFEPTKSNYELAKENLKNYPNIEIVNKGLYSSEQVLKFKDYGIDQWNMIDNYFMGHEWCGSAMPYKLVEIPVVDLDSFFKDKPKSDYPTIVKMDIEGSEYDALLGMKNIMNVSHPSLIICAYHKFEDYWTLSRVIKSICPGYKLKLRHFTDCHFDSIIFGKYEES